MEQGRLVETRGAEPVAQAIRRADLVVVPCGDRQLLMFRVRGGGRAIRSFAVYRDPAVPARLDGYRYVGEQVGAPERGPAEIRVIEDRGDQVHAVIETGEEAGAGPAVRVDAWFRVRVRRRATRISMRARHFALGVCVLGSVWALVRLRLAGSVGDVVCVLSVLGILAVGMTAGMSLWRCPVCGRNAHHDGAAYRYPPASTCRNCGVPV